MGAGEPPPESALQNGGEHNGYTVMPAEAMSGLFGTPSKVAPDSESDTLFDLPTADVTGPPSVHQSPVPFQAPALATDGPTPSASSPTPPSASPLGLNKSPLGDSTGSFDNPLFQDDGEGSGAVEITADGPGGDADSSVSSHANPLFEDDETGDDEEKILRDADIEEGVFRVDSPLTTPQLIGGTPLLDLSQYSLNSKVKIMCKCEYLNPSGSIKDRIAQHIIAQAEASGELKPGMTVVAATSGNTGAAIAMASAQRGYNYIVITNKKTSKEKIDAMKAYGGEVQVSPSGVAPDHPDHYQNIENRLVAENPTSYYGVDQYNNPYNTEAYEVTLGPEIWHQTSGAVTHFIAGGSTGGTVSGTGRYLKSQNPGVRVVMADPHGSVFWDHIVNGVAADDVKVSKSWEMEGVGKDSIPGAFDVNVIDGIVRGDDEDAFAMCREVAANDGLLLGGSAGLNLHAARVLSGEVDDGSVIVTVFPDNGVKYLSKIFNDSWLESKGLEAAAEGNGAVSEDVETKPIVTRVTWKAGVKPPTGGFKDKTTPKTTPKRQAPPRTPKTEQAAALDETHLTLETDSAPPTPAAPHLSHTPELMAELESRRVAAGEMATAMAARDDTIAALETKLRAALAAVESRSKPPLPESPHLSHTPPGEEAAADRVAARLAKAETALGKERAAAEEARASLARERETSAKEAKELRARAESAETQLAVLAETAMASEAKAAKAEAATDGTEDGTAYGTNGAAGARKPDDVEARVAAAEKVCEKLMADNQELVTRVNAQAVELDRLRAREDFSDVDVAAGTETAAPGSQTMRPDVSEGARVEEWERRRSRGIWGFISGADRFVPPGPKRAAAAAAAASERTANASRPEE